MLREQVILLSWEMFQAEGTVSMKVLSKSLFDVNKKTVCWFLQHGK